MLTAAPISVPVVAMMAIDVARNRVAGQATGSRADYDTAEAAVTDGTADGTAANRA